MLEFDNVTPDKFNALRLQLQPYISGGPFIFNVEEHGVKAEVTYDGSKLLIKVIEKPFFVSLNHIKESIQEALDAS